MPYIDVTETGKNIRFLMNEKKLKVKDIQLQFGFENPQAVYNWINGKVLPTVDNLVFLAVILNVTVDELLVVKNR